MLRRSNKSSSSQGLGIGLSIGRKICEALGGEIKIKHSKPNQGTTFEFSIECQRDNYIEESDNLSVEVSSHMSKAFLDRREKLKVKVGKAFQEDDSLLIMSDRSA